MGSRSVERIEETLIEARSPKRECIRFLLLLALFGSLPLFATAESLAQKGSAYPKIKPESKEWCSQLKQAAVRARGLEPGMRSFTLLLASLGLQKCAPKKIRATIIDAFMASVALSDADAAKTGLQSAALRKLLRLDESAVEQLMPQADPEARAEIQGAMVERAVDRRDFDRALSLLNQIPSDQDYPYAAATQLILRLPAGHEAEKRAIFVNAMAHDDREHSSLGGEGDCSAVNCAAGDLSGMVVRFWRHFPPELVLDAIDQILDHSKTDDTQIAIKASSGPINFDNVYQYRLFELLPVLRELDPSKAEQLSNDPQVQAQLNKYPNGLQSLDPTVRDTPLRKGEESGMRGFGVGRGAKVQDGHSAEIYQRQANEILKQAGDDPRQAIATAATLPVQAGHAVPRSETLLRIAQVGWKKNPSASKEALEQMADSLKKVDPAMYGRFGLRVEVGLHVQYCWSEGVQLANNMKDTDLARSLLQEGMEQAERWKGVDGHDNDPNLALKAWWPSVALFSALLKAAAHISPQTALELIHKFQDPDLVTLFQIRLANDRLGADEESLL
jgi:hypothetical protein